jgi:hypothetical protein
MPVFSHRLRGFLLAAILVAGSARIALAEVDLARMARDYAPRVVLHPDERYALANVHHFFATFRLVLDTPLKKVTFDATPEKIAAITHWGWWRKYTTVEARWKDHWWFESRDGCDWQSATPRCDFVYLRARDPIASWAGRVAPEVYWRATDHVAGGRTYTVIQYFFLLMLNDAQNKHDGEWESGAVVVDKEAYARAGRDPAKLRRAIDRILLAGHYRYESVSRDLLLRHAALVFHGDTPRYQHVMSLGGHGAYLFVPQSGEHEASLKCFESVRASREKVYRTWAPPVRLVRVDDETPWIRYVGRWGRRYGIIAKLPMKLRFRVRRVAHCEGKLGLGWLKSRIQVIGSAPYGPRFIHKTVWDWTNFPRRPRETPRAWR